MAVENKYIDTNLAAGKFADSNANGGSSTFTPIIKTFEVAAADDDGSIYRIGRIKSSTVLYQALISNDAMTGATDWDLGVYDTIANGGAVVDKDIFLDGMTLASAQRVVNALTAPAIENLPKQVWELLGLSKDPNKEYDLALTANTVGSAAGTITLNYVVA